jgi:hypothetical protein
LSWASLRFNLQLVERYRLAAARTHLVLRAFYLEHSPMARAQTAWVLVRKGPGAPPIYFSIILCAVQWQPDAKQAMRFARKEDALDMKRAHVMESQPEEVTFG